jgi:transcriptional regulator with XRE-family HTH domain
MGRSLHLDLQRARHLGTDGRGRQVREAARLSLADLAAVIGVDAGTLCRWERDRARPRRDAALRWLRAIDALARDGTDTIASVESP